MKAITQALAWSCVCKRFSNCASRADLFTRVGICGAIFVCWVSTQGMSALDLVTAVANTLQRAFGFTCYGCINNWKQFGRMDALWCPIRFCGMSPRRPGCHFYTKDQSTVVLSELSVSGMSENQTCLREKRRLPHRYTSTGAHGHMHALVLLFSAIFPSKTSCPETQKWELEFNLLMLCFYYETTLFSMTNNRKNWFWVHPTAGQKLSQMCLISFRTWGCMLSACFSALCLCFPSLSELLQDRNLLCSARCIPYSWKKSVCTFTGTETRPAWFLNYWAKCTLDIFGFDTKCVFVIGNNNGSSLLACDVKIAWLSSGTFLCSIHITLQSQTHGVVSPYQFVELCSCYSVQISTPFQLSQYTSHVAVKKQKSSQCWKIFCSSSLGCNNMDFLWTQHCLCLTRTCRHHCHILQSRPCRTETPLSKTDGHREFCSQWFLYLLQVLLEESCLSVVSPPHILTGVLTQSILIWWATRTVFGTGFYAFNDFLTSIN